ncbi:MAG: ribonuclease H-like domain-containing protein [Lachnospiraceae bacterium]|nr:ribonuclease H-like domain-containing protein [Lachnospiraceae bacterium]MCI9151372.1 ribonuclease H-like domain-containing protein [Lachnospiraceae bacterium]
MKTYSKTTALTQTDPLTLQVFHEQALFFDIETTGFSARHHQVYLIGCAFRQGEAITVCQYFAETPAEEPALLCAFLARAAAFSSTISFNGLGFDLPFLAQRCSLLHLDSPLPDMLHVDLFRLLSPFRSIFKLEDMKQKTLEQFLGLTRKDACSGGELINVYRAYCQAPGEEALSLMLLHNYEDVLGMPQLLPLLSYAEFFQGNFTVSSRTEHPYRDYEGAPALELILLLVPAFPLPRRISCGVDEIYLSGSGAELRLRARLYQGELKYFYSNYKDYYYLPQEDVAIHKSVAFYVDKDFRTQAKAATCYSKKSGRFLPQYNDRFSPYFKLEYHDKISYIEMDEDFISSPTLQKEYALHLLQVLSGRA